MRVMYRRRADSLVRANCSSYSTGQNSQPKWACKTRHFGYGIDFFPQNLKSGHRLHRDRSKGNTNPNGRVKREKSVGKSHEMKANSTRPFGLGVSCSIIQRSLKVQEHQVLTTVSTCSHYNTNIQHHTITLSHYHTITLSHLTHHILIFITSSLLPAMQYLKISLVECCRS